MAVVAAANVPEVEMSVAEVDKKAAFCGRGYALLTLTGLMWSGHALHGWTGRKAAVGLGNGRADA
jgi:hypothetical protein